MSECCARGVSLQHQHHHHHQHHPAAAPKGSTGRVPKAAELVVASASQGSILARLDQIDDRLRRLEERHQNNILTASTRESYFTADMRRAAADGAGMAQQQQEEHRKQVGRSLSSELEEVLLKGTLMERLRLLENRILQVSCELDKGSSSSSASTAASSAETRWLLRHPLPPSDSQDPIVLSSLRLVAAPKKFTTLERIQDHKPKAKKAKDPKGVLDAAEKAASKMCKEEKKRMARTRLYKRWFPVAC